MKKVRDNEAWLAAPPVVKFFVGVIPEQRRHSETKKYARLCTVDDDVYGAFLLASEYHQTYRRSGYYPKVDTVGGFGLMSGKINPRRSDNLRLSEAEMLQYVLLRLGVRPQDLQICCSRGTNTGQNLDSYAEALKKVGVVKESICFCLTERLLGRFYLTQIQQHPEINADYLIHAQSEDEVLQLYNGKGLGGGLPYLSEVASIYDRYVRYIHPDKNGKVFMHRLDDKLPAEVVIAGEYLRNRYKLKSPGMSWRKLGQYAVTLADYYRQKKHFEAALDEVICKWIHLLLAQGVEAQMLSTEDTLMSGKRLYLKVD